MVKSKTDALTKIVVAAHTAKSSIIAESAISANTRFGNESVKCAVSSVVTKSGIFVLMIL